MAKNLVIVESPAKAKTIEKFLGKDFLVKSCFGHIRDLSDSGLSVQVENNFEPIYEVSPDKKAIVKELKSLAKKAEVIWLASDEDREGEAISWHLSEVLELDESKTKRIVFHEITKNAILHAIENPRSINKNLVDAQQARRILDRLVGYELSPVLWKKVKPSLSAGRVQSVAVRLVVEKEREIQNFEVKNYFNVQGFFNKSNSEFKASYKEKIETSQRAEELLNILKGAEYRVREVTVKPTKRTPAPPFTTSTLQQEASRKLGFSVSKTMLIAQKLYESGNITYMRTDSVNLSQFAIQSAENEIKTAFGNNYSNPKNFKGKNANAQEAHECIRPTDFSVHRLSGDRDQGRLYELIWKRAIASQMSNAQLEKTNITIENNKNQGMFETQGEVIKFDGFLKVYLESKDDEEEKEDSGLLPKMKEGDDVENQKIIAKERFTRPPARYTEASLVKKLEELGIGRPSTYAPTIATIIKRGYAVKEISEGTERKYLELTLVKDKINSKVNTEITGAEKNKLTPSDVGKVVTDFLVKHFGDILDYSFTAQVEKEFDEISNGYIQWSQMIDKFYGPFHSTVDKTLETADRVKGERLLGEDPKTGKPIYARIGRFGAMVQIGNTEDEEKPKFAGLKKGQTIETITLEEALTLFDLPRVSGTFEGEEMSVAIGRFGPYIRHKSKFYSLGKEDDPYSIDEKRSVEIIKDKRESDAKKFINEFEKEGILVLNGRYGPYIKKGKKNYKIPKNKEASELSLEDCLQLIEDQDKNPTKARGKKK